MSSQGDRASESKGTKNKRMKSLKSVLTRSRNRQSLPCPPSVPPPSSRDQSTKQSTAAGVETSKADDNILEQYRGEIEGLRRQLRESQDAQKREEEKEKEIVELRRQLMEARGGFEPPKPAERRSVDVLPPKASAMLNRDNNDEDTKAVENAIKYLDSVIQRVSNSQKKTGKTTRAKKVADMSPVKSKKSVEIIMPSVLHQPAEGEKVSADDAMPMLEASLPSNDGHSLDTASWQPARATKYLIEASSVDTSSWGGQQSHSLYTAPSVDDTSSWQPARATKDLIDNMSVESSSCLRTAHSAEDTSSWQPVGAMAALLAADDGSVGSISDGSWMTGVEDELEDMQTCISALTAHTMARSANSRASSKPTKDDSAVIVAELYRIQSLLCTVLENKKNMEEVEQQQNEACDGKSPTNAERISARANTITRLWEKYLDEGVSSCVPEDSSKVHGSAQKQRKDAKVQNSRYKLGNPLLQGPQTRKELESVISSLALVQL